MGGQSIYYQANGVKRLPSNEMVVYFHQRMVIFVRGVGRRELKVESVAQHI